MPRAISGKAYFRCVFGVFCLLLVESLSWTQSGRSSGNSPNTQNAVFTIQGTVHSEYSTALPENLEVRLDNIGSPVAQTFLRSDHSFEFHNLPAGTYHVVIKDERFDEVNLGVELFGRSSQNFLLNVMLVPRGNDRKQGRALDADDDLNDTISVALLSQKIPPKAMKHYQKGIMLSHQEKYPEAMAQMHEAISLFPDFYSAHRNLGILYFQAGQTSAAISSLTTALKLNPASYKINYFLGISHLREEHLEDAQQYLIQATALGPQNTRPYYFLGYIYYRKNRLKEAQQSLKKAMEKDDQISKYARLQLANVHIKESQLQEAYQQMELFLRENPDSAEIAMVIANLKALRAVMDQSAIRP
jgi:Tfp pilus assembly protein PilF